jgi:ABC-type branched-subunit amino acid transport system ATPase component
MQITNKNILLDIQDLCCGYGGKPIIDNFNLQVSRGDIVAITGRNGSGKSTLLRAIYQLCLINHGTINYKGTSLIGKTPEQIRMLGIAWFMQKNSIFSRLKVKENLELSLNGMNRIQKQAKKEEIIRNFPIIAKWLEKPAGLLSGGQRQQLSLAMLFAQDADLWLLDEPTAGLDHEKTGLFISSIQHYLEKREENTPGLIIVEHKSGVINILAKRSIILNNFNHENIN